MAGVESKGASKGPRAARGGSRHWGNFSFFACRFFSWSLPVFFFFPGCGGNAPLGPNLLVVTIDTCRADRWGSFGNGRIHTPVLDALTKRGVLFTQAYCPAPTTVPSHTSLFTGLLPPSHGARSNLAHNFTPMAEQFVSTRLAGAGYNTATFTGLANLTSSFGLGIGFQIHDDPVLRGQSTVMHDRERPGSETVDRALQWFGQKPQGPWFLWVHFYDPHAPYVPVRPFNELYRPPSGEPYPYGNVNQHLIVEQALQEGLTDPRAYVGRYEAEIASVDAQIGRILRRLKAAGQEQNTLVVVTADHGESLGEEGFYFAHTWRLNEPSLLIPLVFSWPGHLPEGKVLDDVVRSIDVPATLYDLLKLPQPLFQQGASLVPLWKGRSGQKERSVYAEIGATEVAPANRVVSWRKGRWKLLHTPDTDRFYWAPVANRLYDLDEDPGEEKDVAPLHPELVDQMLKELHGAVKAPLQVPSGVQEPLDQAVEEQLRSLGYLQGGSPSRKPVIIDSKALANLLPAPVLLSPPHELTAYDPPRFRWDPVTGAKAYVAHIAYQAFDTPPIEIASEHTDLNAIITDRYWRELPQGKYTWWVNAISQDGRPGAGSAHWTFTKEAARYFELPVSYPWVLEAEELPANLGEVVAVKGASGGKARRVGAESRLAGYMLFGPEVVLPEGEYEVFFTVQGRGGVEGSLAWLDVAWENGAKMLAQARLQDGGKDSWGSVALPFSTDGSHPLEFRIYRLPEAGLSVDCVRVHKRKR